VFLTRPPKKKKKGGEDADKGKAGAGAGAGAKGKPVVIPAIDDMPLPDYREALEKLKLKVEVTRVISAKKKDTVLAVDPEPGTEAKTGDTVNVRASAGAPDLAVETEGLIQRVDPRNGQERGRIPDGEGTAVEPTFTPDGKQILYRSDNTLKLSALTDGAKPRTVYDGGDPVRLPMIASNGETVAMLRRLEEDGDLCLGRIRHPRMRVLCLADDGWDLFGRPAWRKDGKVLIVPAAKQGDPKTFALRVYETSHPFTIDPARWSGRVATDVTTPGKGVIAAAFSPDGEKLAAVTNLVSGRFEIVTAGADDVELADPKSTGVAACDLAWRSDSKEMAFVEGGAACAAPSGKVQRFLLSKPRDATRVVDDGRHPAYRPIELDD